MPLDFGLRRWHLDHVHPVPFAAQPGAQACHQFDRVEPVGLGAPRVALHRDAGRVDRQRFVSQVDERSADPEGVLAGFIHYRHTAVLLQLPFALHVFDHRRCVGKTLGRFCIPHRMNGRLVSLAVVQCDLPASVRQFQGHCQNGFIRRKILALSRLLCVLLQWWFALSF